MTEPVVGMKFGSYNSILLSTPTKVNWQNTDMYSLNDGTYRQETKIGKTRNGEKFYSHIGALVPDTNKVNKPKQKYAEMNLNGLVFDGYTYKRPEYLSENSLDITSDVKFQRIRGQNTYALDLNANGIVDEGEIFDIKDCDGIKDYEKLDGSYKKLNIEM